MERDDELDPSLQRSLARIESTADLICRGIAFFDPDLVGADLADELRDLRALLARLMADPLPGEHREGADLASLASGLARRALGAVPVPLRIEVEDGRVPPSAPAPALLQAAVRRLIQIGVGHAGAGGTVTLAPVTVDGDPALHLCARPAAGRHAASALPPSARCRTLADFATGLGGALELEAGPTAELSARLRLPRRRP